MVLCCGRKNKRNGKDENQEDESVPLRTEVSNKDTALTKAEHGHPDTSRHLRLLRISDKSFVMGVTKLSKRIYVLCKHPSLLVVYEDEEAFGIVTEVALKDIDAPWDIASSKISSCLYITDCNSSCIYKITIPSHVVTPWLGNAGYPNTLTVTNPDDQVLLVRYGRPSSLEIYGSEAELIQQIELPADVEYPKHAVRTSVGNFVVSGKQKGSEVWRAFEVTVRGEILRQTMDLAAMAGPLAESYHLATDLTNRLMVADCWKNRVLLFDEGYQLKLKLPTDDSTELKWPWRLHYAPEENQLLVLNAGSVYGKDEDTVDKDGTGNTGRRDAYVIHIYDV